MGYDISLFKVPTKLKGQHINDDILFDIAYSGDNADCLIAYTNFSTGNPKSVDFEEVFDIRLTNDDFFKIYTISDYNDAMKRLKTMSLEDGLLERINKFLKVIEHELNKGEIIFFSCG